MRSPASLNSLLVIPMHLLPCRAESNDVRYEFHLDARQFAGIEAKVAAHFGRAVGAVEIEERFLPRAAHVYMRWAVVAGVYDDAVAAESQDGRHGRRIPQTQAVRLSSPLIDQSCRWCPATVRQGLANGSQEVLWGADRRRGLPARRCAARRGRRRF